MKRNRVSTFEMACLALIVLFCNVFISCASKRTANPNSDSSLHVSSPGKFIAEPEPTRYFVFKDGKYVETVPDKVPEMIGGKEKMYQIQANNIRYPPLARQREISGTVYVTVIVNEFGQLEDAFVSRGIGAGCDEETLRVVQLIGQNGFEPAQLEGIPVKVKYDIFMRFILQ